VLLDQRLDRAVTEDFKKPSFHQDPRKGRVDGVSFEGSNDQIEIPSGINITGKVFKSKGFAAIGDYSGDKWYTNATNYWEENAITIG
jgi:hypothetical protein